MCVSVCCFNSVLASYFTLERYLIMAPLRADTCSEFFKDNLGVLPLNAVFGLFDICGILIFLK